MYIPTRVQPRTKLQECLFAGDSCRNEARHCLLNQIVKHVSRMGEDLIHAELELELFLTNKKYDVL